MSDFFKGMRYFFAGFGLITKPGIKRFVIIPLLINIAIFAMLFAFMVDIISDWTSATIDSWPVWLHWIKYVIFLLFVGIYLFFFTFLFSALGTCLAAPFNGLLSGAIELYLTGRPLEDRTVWQNVRDVPRIIGRQINIILYFLLIAIIIWFITAIPVINMIGFVFWFLFSAWFLTLQYMDFPTDNHRIPLSMVRGWLRERRVMTFGFGVALLACLAVPGLNFFAMPVAVAGATKFFVGEFDLSANIK